MSAMKSVIYTTVGDSTWTVPTGVNHVWVNMVAGTCGCGSSINDGGYGGAGSGEAAFHVPIAVTPTGSLNLHVGAGGVGGYWVYTGGLNANYVASTKGGDTTCGPFRVKGSEEVPAPVTQEGGSGGGPSGQFRGTGENNWLQNSPPNVPKKASPLHFGGTSGGGGGVSTPGAVYPGSGNGGFLKGGAGGTNVGHGGGGGGAASIWGIGGHGGNSSGGAGEQAFNSGAGSGASANGAFFAGSAPVDGFSGRVEIFYVEP